MGKSEEQLKGETMEVTMLGIRVEKELKALFQKVAREERRSVSNFIINAVVTYMKEHHGIDYKMPEEEEE